MNEESKQILVRILALTDSTWAPNRSWSGKRPAVIYEARERFKAQGVRFKAGGDQAARKRQQRKLEKLAKEGLLVISRLKFRTRGVRLTDEGEQYARALCALPGVASSISLLFDVVEAGGNVPENRLTGIKWGDTKDYEARQGLVWIENVALPALIRGWLTSNSTMRGHVVYRITDQGRAVAEDPPDAEEVAVETGMFDEELEALYYNMFKNRQSHFDNVRPESAHEIGALPCSMLALA